MSHFSTLLWKEFRDNLYLIICAIATQFLTVVFCFFWMAPYAFTESTLTDQFASSLVFGSLGGLVLSQLIILCLGGMLVGSERTARTFEFLFNQPITRVSIISSKLVFALIFFVGVWITGLFLIWIGFQLIEEGFLQSLSIQFYFEVGVVGLLMFASSWVVSNKIDSVVLSITLGALITTIFFSAVAASCQRLIESQYYAAWTKITIAPIIAAALIAIGVYFFISRKSP